jgi:DNA-binding NtrC family response regulator
MKTRMFKEAKRETVDQFERAYLLELLQETRSSLAAMSRASGLSRKYIRILLRKHDLRDQVGDRGAQVVGRLGVDQDDDPFNW